MRGRRGEELNRGTLALSLVRPLLCAPPVVLVAPREARRPPTSRICTVPLLHFHPPARFWVADRFLDGPHHSIFRPRDRADVG